MIGKENASEIGIDVAFADPRRERIEALKRRIRAGTYVVDAELLADRMLRASEPQVVVH